MGNLNRKQSKYAGRNTQPLSNAAADGMGAPLHSGAMLGLTWYVKPASSCRHLNLLDVQSFRD